MIKAIRVQNFQRIDAPLQIPLGPVTVLVGENGSGKSSVLKAIHWAIRCATLADERNKVTLEQMDFVPSKDFLDLAHKLKLQNSAVGRKVTVCLIDENDAETVITIGAARNDAGVLVGAAGPLVAEFINYEIPSTAYIPGLAGAAEEETILAVPIMHRKASSGEGGSVLRQIILAHAGGVPESGQSYTELLELSKWVSKVLPDTKFWVKFDRLRDRYIDVKFLTPEMHVPGQGIYVSWKSIDMAGTGFLQVVQIFAYLLYFKPKLLLIDEPDAHLHPGRQQLLIKALEGAAIEFPSTQIVLTTHSPSLVRALSNRAAINWIDQGAVRANGAIVRERMGWNALDKDLIIFTEDGNTDVLNGIINQWPSLAQKCAIWPTFGKDSLPDGKRIAALRKKLGIKILLHRDSDFMSNTDIEEWCKLRMYDTNMVPVWVTSGSDIESVFCSADHIARVFGIGVDIANELLEEALNCFEESVSMQEFANAYIDVVNKLPKVGNRNAIARWAELGGYSLKTIKGKRLLYLIKKYCLTFLPKYGLALSIGKRNNLSDCIDDEQLAADLKEKIELALA
jgi:predicted ATPase